jgi:hypothetical protein
MEDMSAQLGNWDWDPKTRSFTLTWVESASLTAREIQCISRDCATSFVPSTPTTSSTGQDASKRGVRSRNTACVVPFWNFADVVLVVMMKMSGSG